MATISSAVNGGSTIWPVAVPTLTTPVIIPRRGPNQRAMVDSVTTSWVARPSPRKIPNSATSCHGAPMIEMSAKPTPYSMPVAPRTTVGPYRSLMRPPKYASNPMTRMASEVLPERIVRGQPNSSSNTSKKSPIENSSPTIVNCVTRAPKTIGYRGSMSDQLTGSAPPSSTRRAMKASIASTVPGSTSGGRNSASTCCQRSCARSVAVRAPDSCH